MQDNLDMELLQTLVAIADTGSFAAASKLVHRTQSAISMQMKRLEEIVGQPLFQKEGRRSVLTLHGQNLLLYARRILTLQQEALASFRSPEIQGEVRFGVCDDYVEGLLPPILASFAAQYPRVHIRLDSESSKELISATVEGQLDFSLVNAISSQLEFETLTSEPLVWVMSRHHSTEEGQPLTLAFENSCLWGIWAKKALDDQKIHYRVGYSTRNHNGTIAMVEAGLAISVLSRSTVPPQLRILTEADGFPVLPLSEIGLIVGPKGLSPASQKLADAVRQNLSARSIAA
ncbi:LysR substrate-binding domain-containing protein [Granulosicoccus antarcticus]|uniref:HTH-type transcriptional regulator CynR n=1 Tax=Granulosicoccus antarcticus IMCC3135 TaxID=1192854 RepID=A0A2Z2P1K8_9GAMM|nr:LysR substrate-binding domain-containing protein [Granulosicoccus antarcticus]ASJ76715.1 HTH-type transcriptional regulator CynR [Granulosicoccus antarcticus IMCC3135]